MRSRQFTLAGWLEPAGDIGGDRFDFRMERDTLHLCMTDAMGMRSARRSWPRVLVGRFANARREGVELGEQARSANAELADTPPEAAS